MCGIAGLFSIQGKGIAPYIKPMTDIIRHRGPNDEGYAVFSQDKGALYFYGDDSKQNGSKLNHKRAQRHISLLKEEHAVVCLGHRRLSIVDLSFDAHQPFCSPDGRYTLAYNGEIYNYIELREQLKSMGRVFYTSSDTEVLLNAYMEWGADCLNKFNGMFAFIIYDSHSKKTFIARDRFGVKPLYYWFSPAGFLAIASEIKQFTVLPGWQAQGNHQAIYDYLMWGVADHTDSTMFDSVKQLRAGHYAKFEISQVLKNEFQPVCWYQLKTKPITFERSPREEVFELLYDAINIRTRSDVPIGTGLSGGVDSSSIVCLLNTILKQQGNGKLQNTFSACTNEKAYSEESFIRKVVDATQVNAHFVYLDPLSLNEQLSKVAWHQDEPFSSTSIFAEWCVFDLVSQTNVKVTLDGHGADELFAGYHCFYSTYLQELLRQGKWRDLIRNYGKIKELHSYNFILLLRSLFETLPYKVQQFLLFHILNNLRGRAHLNLQKLSGFDKYQCFRTRSAASLSELSKLK